MKRRIEGTPQALPTIAQGQRSATLGRDPRSATLGRWHPISPSTLKGLPNSAGRSGTLSGFMRKCDPLPRVRGSAATLG